MSRYILYIVGLSTSHVYCLYQVHPEFGFQDRETAAAQLLQEYGPHSHLIPPYDHPDIIAGQGTMAQEILEQVLYLPNF